MAKNSYSECGWLIDYLIKRYNTTLSKISLESGINFGSLSAIASDKINLTEANRVKLEKVYPEITQEFISQKVKDQSPIQKDKEFSFLKKQENFADLHANIEAKSTMSITIEDYVALREQLAAERASKEAYKEINKDLTDRLERIAEKHQELASKEGNKTSASKDVKNPLTHSH